jgi:hypothetical protein
MKMKPALEQIPAAEPQLQGGLARLLQWSQRFPISAVMLVSVVAVIISSYPIIFCGKSYVSPAKGLPLVYDEGAPLPGMTAESTVNDHGSDSAVTQIWGVPMGLVESRSLLGNRELPLWNRYSFGGYTLIGQAISMLGDPLHLIVILGHSTAAAWDAKFILAKFLFCMGFGLLIGRLLKSVALSLVFAALAAYCGAFFYINNHPSFFVMCYAPWILLSALAWLDPEPKCRTRWSLLWLVANFACFNAGHPELAVILIGGLNLAALVTSVIRCSNFSAAVKVLVRISAGTMVFLGFTAPVWLAFLASLPGSFSLHSEIRVHQLPVVSLLGIFDDVFFRLPLKNDSFAAVAPGSSFLIAVGALLALLQWRQFKNEPFFWINTVAIVFWGGCVFGWIPAPVLSAVPMLNRIGHTYTEFSFLLVIHLTIQCAYGFKALGNIASVYRMLPGLLAIAAILGVMLLLFCLGLTHRPVPWGYVGFVAAGAFGTPLLFVFLKQTAAPLPLYGCVLILILGFIPQFRFGLYNFGDGNFVMLPGPRVALDAPSPAIEEIKKDASMPYRVVGVQRILYGDYAAVYGLEDIRSSAPMVSGELAKLIRTFPGVLTNEDWPVQVVNPVAAHPLLNLLNVKYLLTPARINVQEGLGFRLAADRDLGVLENLEVWPRAFFCNKVSAIPSTEEFIRKLTETRDKPFIAMTPEEIGKHPAITHLQSTSDATISPASHYQLSVNSTSFDIHAASDGIVCLTECDAPDFKVTANGISKPVFSINRAFKGVYLDKAGDYHIEFMYQPRYWRVSCTLLWIGCLSVAVFVVGAARKTSRAGTAALSEASNPNPHSDSGNA